MSHQVHLTTPRLILREIDESDSDALYDYWRLESFYRFRVVPIPTPEFVRSCVQQYITDRLAHPRSNYWLAICHRHSPSRCIGLVSLRRADLEPGTAEIGYSIHHNEVGNGLATEAAHTMIQFGIRDLHLRRFIARTAEPNYASRRVLTKLGFREVEPIANPRPIRGQVISALLLKLIPGADAG